MSDDSNLILNPTKDHRKTMVQNEDLSSDSSTHSPIGPQLPLPPPANESANENGSESDSSEEFGPALPPGFGESTNAIQHKKSSIGPSLPPGFEVAHFLQENNDDDDDEIIGPVPEGHVDRNHQYDASTRKKHKNEANTSQREKWMLEPGKALAKSLTLQTKSVTQFSQSRNAKKDMPLTKEQQLELEMVAEKEGKMKEFLQKYEQTNKRDASLMDLHRDKLKKHKKTKTHEATERREFDRDRDLNVPKMDNKKRNTFMREASSDFTTRFSGGRYQKFL